MAKTITPTDLNLFTLTNLVIRNGGRATFANRIEATERNGISRCMAAGLIAVEGSSLTLTAEGTPIVLRRLRAAVAQFSSPTYRGSAFHEKLLAEAQAALDAFEKAVRS